MFALKRAGSPRITPTAASASASPSAAWAARCGTRPQTSGTSCRCSGEVSITNSVPYKPLSLPASRTRGEKIRDFLLTGFCRSTRARYLVAQMQARETIPGEAWGTDPDRHILANRIAAVIQEEIEWPNVNFIPEDPMRLVLFKLDTEGLFWDNMEIECAIHEIEYIVGRSLSVEDLESLCAGTFGEAVDVLLEIQRDTSRQHNSM